jgi:hypothetical protein
VRDFSSFLDHLQCGNYEMVNAEVQCYRSRNFRIADNSDIDLVYAGWVPEMGVAGLVVLTPVYDKLGLVRRR